MNAKKEQFIKVEDAQGQSKEMIRQMDDLGGRLGDLEKRAKGIESSLGFSKFIMVGVIVVFFLAFLTFVLDAWKLHRDTYQEYKTAIENLSMKRDAERQQAELDKLDLIIEEIKRLNTTTNQKHPQGSSK